MGLEVSMDGAWCAEGGSEVGIGASIVLAAGARP